MKSTRNGGYELYKRLSPSFCKLKGNCFKAKIMTINCGIHKILEVQYMTIAERTEEKLKHKNLPTVKMFYLRANGDKMYM